MVKCSVLSNSLNCHIHLQITSHGCVVQVKTTCNYVTHDDEPRIAQSAAKALHKTKRPPAHHNTSCSGPAIPLLVKGSPIERGQQRVSAKLRCAWMAVVVIQWRHWITILHMRAQCWIPHKIVYMTRPIHVANTCASVNMRVRMGACVLICARPK